MNTQLKLPDFVNGLESDHPIRLYYEENIHIKNLLVELSQTDPQSEYQKFYNIFNHLAQVEKRYVRKENQLFPYLEKAGWTGPSQGMWTFHDSNRALIKKVREKIESKSWDGIKADIETMISELARMTQVEEVRLFPMSMQLLAESAWQEMKEGESEIGWAHRDSVATSEIEGPHQSPGSTDGLNGLIKLSEGKMTQEQIDLMLQFIPFDLTYVDENDKVIFYNRGEERVFPRSAGVIGREVRFCHPPKSVDKVLRILEEFKKGTRDVADFWIQYRGQFIHIRYFAIRDKNKNYKGVIEVSQDITDIKKLEGENRLLNWD